MAAPPPTMEEAGILVLSNTRPFRVAYGTVLSVVTLAQLLVAASYVRNRTRTSLELAQPVPMALFATAAAVATAGCYLLVDSDGGGGGDGNWRCRLRQPVLLLSVHLMGCVLAGRAWRMGRLLSDPLSSSSSAPAGDGITNSSSNADQRARRGRGLGRGLGLRCNVVCCSRTDAVDLLRRWRSTTLDVLTALSDWNLPRCSRSCFGEGDCWRWNGCLKNRGNANSSRGGAGGGRNRSRKSKSISKRAEVPLAALLRVVAVLLAPQAVLQILNLAVPALRAAGSVQSYALPGMDSGGSGGIAIAIARRDCAAPAVGSWPLATGVVLATVPFLLALVLNVRVPGVALQDLVNELRPLTISVAVFGIVAAVAGPGLVMMMTSSSGSNSAAVSPDVRTYLLASLVLSWTGSLFYHVAWVKIRGQLHFQCSRRVTHSQHPKQGQRDTSSAASGTAAAGRGRHQHKSLRRAVSTSSSAGGHNAAGSRRSLANIEEHESRRVEAETLLDMGQMFFVLGRRDKALECYNEALSMWQTSSSDRGGHGVTKNLIGDLFTRDEVHAFSAKDVEIIGRILLSKSKAMHAANSEGARTWIAALAVLENAPAAKSMKDRSVVYPCYNGLSGFLGLGIIEQDEGFTFEANLAKRFVRDTRMSSYHLARALAMQCEVTSRRGDWGVCFKSLELMESIYSLEHHSPLLVKDYIQDRCAQAISMSILWYDMNGDTEKAQRTCKRAINMITLLSQTDDKAHAMLQRIRYIMPIVRYLKENGRGKQAKDLWDVHVLQKFQKMHGNSPPKQVAGASADILFRPLKCLLTLKASDSNSYEGADDDIHWCIEELKYDSKPEEVVDSNWTLNAGWSPSSLSAEVCLCFSKNLARDDPRWIKLIQKGLLLARKADAFMKDCEGRPRLHIPYNAHAPVIAELESVANDNGIDCPENRPQKATSVVGKSATMRFSDAFQDESESGQQSNRSTSLLFESTMIGGDDLLDLEAGSVDGYFQDNFKNSRRSVSSISFAESK